MIPGLNVSSDKYMVLILNAEF